MTKKWSVVIPVYLGNNSSSAGVFRRSLDSYSSVRYEDMEIVICCDGFDERVRQYVDDSSCNFPVKIVHIKKRGQSAATNKAVKEAEGEYLLFFAQDIFPTENIIHEHERFHNQGQKRVVLGKIPFHPEIPDTPFMNYLKNSTNQFAYQRLKSGTEVPPTFLYAPNFSMKKEDFLKIGGFREDLPFGSQDTELGIRLHNEGYKLIYNENAVVFHWHPQTFNENIHKQYIIGKSAVRLAEIHPNYRKKDWLKEKVLERYVGYKNMAERLYILAKQIEQENCMVITRVKLSSVGPYEQDALWFIYDNVTKFHFYRGVHDAFTELEGDSWKENTFVLWRINESNPEPEFYLVKSDGTKEKVSW